MFGNSKVTVVVGDNRGMAAGSTALEIPFCFPEVTGNIWSPSHLANIDQYNGKQCNEIQSLAKLLDHRKGLLQL